MLLAFLIIVATATCAIKSAPKLPPLCSKDNFLSPVPCRLLAKYGLPRR